MSARTASGAPVASGRRAWLRAALCLSLAGAGSVAAHPGVSEASGASSLSLSVPVAILVSAPVMALSAGAVLTVTAVQHTAEGSLWVLRRVADGVSVTLSVSAQALATSALLATVAVGAVLGVTALAAGWLLSLAGAVLCFVPNALGNALLHDERVTR